MNIGNKYLGDFCLLFERQFQFGQKSDMHSKCTSMKIQTQSATYANHQKIVDSFLVKDLSMYENEAVCK